MSEPTHKDSGDKHQGEQRTSPYPMSRLAPAHDLVNVARQIQDADLMLGTVTHARLSVIAAQMKALKEEAERILEETRRSLDLHRARCSFVRRPGGVYHAYRKADGEVWLSMISPEEWGDPSPDRSFVGTYRLELDQSWTPLRGEHAPPEGAGKDAGDVPTARELVTRLLSSG
jgi:hypothetical protein